MRKSVDVVVAGGGIMGLHSALQIKRRAPDLTVRVVEKARGLGQGSSGYSSALLRCRYSTVEMMALASEGLRAHKQWGDYLQLLQPEATFTQHPVLWAMPGADWHADARRLAQLGLASSVLSQKEVAARFPNLAFEKDGLETYLVEEETGYFDPNGALNDLVKACREAQVEVQLGTGVTCANWHVGSDGRVAIDSVTLTDGSTVPSGALLNAMGPWCTHLHHSAGYNCPWDLSPVRIQALHRSLPREGSDSIALESIPIVCDVINGIYFRPHLQSDYIVVSTVLPEEEEERVHPDSFNTAADPESRTRFLSALQERVPTLPPRGQVRSYSALYTVNFNDGHPIVGQPATHSNYFVASGFTGHGFKISPVVGAMLAKAITSLGDAQLDSSVSPGFLHPDRKPLGTKASVLA